MRHSRGESIALTPSRPRRRLMSSMLMVGLVLVGLIGAVAFFASSGSPADSYNMGMRSARTSSPYFGSSGASPLTSASVTGRPSEFTDHPAAREILPPGDPTLGRDLTIWTILRELTVTDLNSINFAGNTQTDWLETLHTYNAIQSWVRLPGVKIILFGDERSCDFVMSVPCMHPELNVPRYDCLFARAAELADTEYIMYSNSDMVYFEDILYAMHSVASQHEDFLMVGQRIDILYPRLIDFNNPMWREDFKRTVERYGKTHGKYGIDYFLYRTRYARPMPPFIVGRVRWDNWLLAQFIGNQNAAAVDATEVVFAVHLNHMKVGGSHSRSGTDYNINLTKSDAVDPKKLGDVESCDYYLAPIPNSPGNALSPKNLPAGESAPSVFTRPGADFSTTSSAPSGACPFCTLRPKEQSIDVMLAKQADPQTRDVIVATVNSGYLDFSINWMCTLLRIGRKNFLFHATDRAMYTILRDRGLPVIYYESNIALEYKALLAQSANGSFIVSADETAADGTPREKAYDYGSVAYQALMNSRTEFIYKILQKGYNVLLSDVDVVFLRDPLQFVDRNLDIQGGAHKVEKITGGFIYFRATDAARALWVKVLLQHRTVFKKIQAMENFNIHSMTEQELVNELLKAAKPDEIKWGTIDEKVVADGKRFFIDKLSQKNGEWPAAIHNNYIIGVDNKRQRFMNISMWLVDDDLRCQAFPGLQAPTPYTLPLAHVTGPPARGSSGMRALASSPAALSPGNGPVPATVKDFRLTVKIIAFNRPRALLRLFRSLDAADFMGDKVDLDIYIDFPSPELVANATLEQNDPNNEADISLQEYARVRQMSEVYRWRHGRKQVHARDKHYGLAGQWLASWFPMGTTEIAIILEDDNIVSPYFYVWLKRAVEYYYFNPEQFDPRVYGIMLQSQHMIPGRYPKRPKEFLPHDAKFFRYQLLSTWGPVFFPHHWAEFISWFNEKSSDPSFQPLFSNMITNSWFLARGGGRAVWSAWFMRFAAERGYYALYTNFPDGQAFVVNYRDKGVNYHKDQGANSPMVEHIMPYMDVLPPMKELPLYDFHFNRIDPEDPSILEDRAIYSDIFNIEIN